MRGFARFLCKNTTLADDLVQETVVRALRAQDQFVENTSLKAWLFTIQRNIFYEQKRRSSREETVFQDYEKSQSEPTRNNNQNARDAITDLSSFLWELPDTLREAIILVGAQELSYEDAAAVCNVPIGTIKARVSRARAQLAELAKEHSII
ncbi:sigma-70 family RNA polymerase sigma factor [Swingsia samuiensis]|uniref:sigma-70 family RNA polymerase sigma factor n=1 Tax=Swingsia samuiensis TaxID=1293412 RepID=UPI001FEA041D|nr:sigma-70 family RNA polymerase sigma factor [Swingsia samuiensis]